MVQNRSFKDYVSARFYNELWDAVVDYVEHNHRTLDVFAYSVSEIDKAELSDLAITRVFVDDLPGMDIAFDILLEAELEISEIDRNRDRIAEVRQWFKISCKGDLSRNLDDFTILATEEYNYRDKQMKPMSDTLVPIIPKERLEAVAGDFLRRYYKEELREPMAIDPMVLAQRMGLSVHLQHITDDFSTFGQIFFIDCETEIYNKSTDSFETVQVEKGTIYVDPDAYFLRNLGSVNNTIVHECVHWELHRKAFELERLYNESVSKIQCETVGGIKNNHHEATDWMEWQANSLAPRIQMPLGMFKTKAFEFIKRFSKELGISEVVEVMEPVIDALATFFGVSRLAAKIRMIDVGYEEAIGAFTYIDGRYIKPHTFKKGFLQRNQTFSISAEDAAIQSITNPNLMVVLEEYNFLFVDSHFVVDHPKYVTRDLFGRTALTNYARKHMDECCLVFDLSLRTGVRERYHRECFLNRDEGALISFDIVYSKGYQFAAPEKQIELLKKVVMEEAAIYNELPNNLPGSLKRLKDWRGVTFSELADRALINERTVRRIVNGEEPGSLNSIILICLALHLPPKISRHVIAQSQFSLSYSNENHIWYQFVLDHKYANTLDEIRTFLAERGAEPL